MQKILKRIRHFFHFALAQQAEVNEAPNIKGDLIDLEQLQKRMAQKK